MYAHVQVPNCTLASSLVAHSAFVGGRFIASCSQVIPFIASQYRKDKIWLRRSKPSKRDYHVMVCIDDSKSMSDNHAGSMALQAMLLICKAMSRLELGDIGVTSFGEKVC